MNQDKMIEYLKQLAKLGITDVMICRRANVSNTTLWNIRNGNISQKKIEQIREAIDKFIDELQALHIEVSKK
jgi:predicted transcriptional regulator